MAGFPVEVTDNGFPVTITGSSDSIISDIYNKSYWTNLNDFVVPSSGIVGYSVINNAIEVAANQANILTYPYVTALNEFVLSMTYVASNGQTNAAGLRIGFKSINPVNTSSVDFWFDEVTRKIMVYKSSDDSTTAGTQILSSYVVGDTIKLTVNALISGYTIQVQNVTSGNIITRTEQFYGPSKNTSNVVITAQNTTVAYSIKNILFGSTNKKGGVWVVGDSIDVGSAATSAPNRYAVRVGAQIAAGSGDRVEEVLARIPEILKLDPATLLLKIGTNNSNINTWQTNYALLTSKLRAAGINFINVTPPPTSLRDMTPYVDWLKLVYPNNTIDIFTPMKDASTTAMNPIYDSGDGVHPSNAGHLIMAETILNSGKLVATKYKTEMSSVYARETPTGINPDVYGLSMLGVNEAGKINYIKELLAYNPTSNRITGNIGFTLTGVSFEAQSFRGNTNIVMSSQGNNDVVFSASSSALLLGRMYGANNVASNGLGGMHFGNRGMNDPGFERYRFAGKLMSETLNVSILPVFADNTAAASLSVGEVYRTSTGELRVRI
jgi:lysophospholipase L1-like esterase